MSLTLSQIKSYAPIVKFHPEEKYFPMDPMEFIEKSRFRHHKGWAMPDQGYNKRERKWETNDEKSEEYYNIPVNYINSFRQRHGKNRRPRDPYCGNSWNVFLQPRGKPKGIKYPTGKVPAFYYSETVGLSKVPFFGNLNIPQETFEKIGYWWFMGYNDGPSFQNHQGDWEHVNVFVKNYDIEVVHFFAHNDFKSVSRDHLTREDDKFIVYCAKGTHASYWKSEEFDLMWGLLKDETQDGGEKWDISKNLLSLRTQPWKYYAGAWGEVGEFEGTTGPLGPWFKK